MCLRNAPSMLLAACGVLLIIRGAHLASVLEPHSNKANRASSETERLLQTGSVYDLFQVPSSTQSLGRQRTAIAGYHSSVAQNKHDKLLPRDVVAPTRNQSETSATFLHTDSRQSLGLWNKREDVHQLSDQDSLLVDTELETVTKPSEQLVESDKLPRALLTDVTTYSVVDKGTLDQRTSKRDCTHVSTIAHRRRDARRLLRTPVDASKLTRQRRVDPISPSQEQFRCVSSPHQPRLSQLWALNSVAAILEYIELARVDVEPCDARVCMLNYDLSSFTSGLEREFADQVTATLQLVNAVNSLLRYEAKLSESVESALLLSLVEADERIFSATIFFWTEEEETRRSTSATRNKTTRRGYVSRRSRDEGQDDDFLARQLREYSTLQPQQYSSACTKAEEGSEPEVIRTTRADTLWGRFSLRCLPNSEKLWTISFLAPFFRCDEQRQLYQGMLKADFNLTTMDINQCTDERRPFPKSHRCPQHSTCTHIPGRGFRHGSYRCDCLPSYYDNSTAPPTSLPRPPDSPFPDPSSTSSHLPLYSHSPSSLAHAHYVTWLLNDGLGSEGTAEYFHCLPCSAGCQDCVNGSTCLLVYDSLTRGIPMGIESLCITLCVALTFTIVHLRKTKVMKASFWCLLEILIVGAILLNLTLLIVSLMIMYKVVVQYFEPTELLCLLVPWLREVGFTVVYGALILKVYRVLASFQSRKAHRVQVRDKDLFKYLCCMIVVVVGYMAAWTAVTLDNNTSSSSALLDYRFTEDRLKYVVCRSTWWDYVIEIAELLFMLFGVYLCYRARSAPSICRELRFVTFAICNETVVSTAFYIARVVCTLHPDYTFLLYFCRCQLTVSVMVLLVLGPKLWYSHRPADDEPRRRAYSGTDLPENAASCPEAVKLNSTINPNGDVDVGDINLAEMSPDDIRTELKRLYTQLQIYKTKTMRQDNPHISKRRGGRKQTHRRFSLQAFHSKHKHHHGGTTGGGGPGGGGGGGGSDRGEVSVDRGDTEVSRTPEDSTNSAEGVSIYMDEPSVAETNVRTPTVTFKSDRHKGK